MVVNYRVLRWLAMLLCCISCSPSMGCSRAQLISNLAASRSRDVNKMGVRVYFSLDVSQINGEPSQRYFSNYQFTPRLVKMAPEVSKQLVIYKQRWNKDATVLNKRSFSLNYGQDEARFEAKAGEWTLYSEPGFKGRSVTINPCHGQMRIPFAVKSTRPTKAKGIRQYRGNYYVSFIDFIQWMRVAFPRVSLRHHWSVYYYLNQMLCYDLTSEIFRDNGGLVLVNNAGDVIADHPFNRAVPFGHTTEFFAFECPPLFPGERPLVVFQSVLNPSNFLGVRSSQGELELVSDTDGFEDSEFTLEPMGQSGFAFLKSRLQCSYVALDRTRTQRFELLSRRPPTSIGSFILL